MGVFAVAVFLMLITPGPGVLSTAGVGASFGKQAGYRYVTGLLIGTNLVAIAVITGLAGVILTIPVLRTVLLYASIAYLCYLAYRIAFAGSEIAFINSAKPPGIKDALLLQAINPKAYVVNTTLFTGFAFQGTPLWQETIYKFLIINAIWIPIHLLWLAAGIGLKKLALARKTQRLINVMMGLSLLTVVALAAYMN
jgi:threonine/homoserine/homoserine lactone efflux protein